MRKLTFILAACIFLVACYTLYSSLDATANKKRTVYERGRKEIVELENRLKQLQDELNKNEQVINEIRHRINQYVGGPSYTVQQPIKSVDELKNYVSQQSQNLKIDQTIESKVMKQYSPALNASYCSFSNKSPTATDVQMLDVYEMLKFDNPDGGVWKQGWDVTYDKSAVEKSPKLLVYVVPHSHTDPGWIKTFEKYYQDQTKNILNHMVAKLTAEPKMKFIYAEISFFERWWRDIDENKRNSVRKLMENGQFEILTGAWVMTDEANAHYFSMIDQMIEGNQWLENHLNYKPKNHWSIDPFGLSPTMAYLLKLANFSTMTVQRVHYSVKKSFALEKKLEFMWRQLWSGNEESDILCHIFPFYSYDVPHTCGPDPKICCQFDFRRLSGGGIGCPWHVPPVVITESNVEERAGVLLDQYRKKAELYRTNVLLIPLGDDFRYDTEQEWNSQFENYERLFAYMNSRSNWNVQAQFGTINDYFQALYRSTETKVGLKPKDFPVLSGDFFTYADRDDHYWSGYYTSRPFYKRMDRVLQHYLRGAEIAFSLSTAYVNRHNATGGYPSKQLFPMLVNARRNLGLFQHHDGITGTAKDNVVVDYGTRLLQSIQDCQAIMSASVHLLTSSDKKSVHQEVGSLPLEFVERLANHDSIPENVVLSVGSTDKSIFVYNSLAFERREIVCIHAATTNLAIVDTANENVVVTDVQINPVIFKDRDRMEVSNTIFEICWLTTVPPLGVVRYVVKEGESTSASKSTITTNFPTTLNERFKTRKFDSDVFVVRTPHYVATFSQKTGFLTKLRVGKDGDERPVEISFARYGTTTEKDKSGAYLFLPGGSSSDVPMVDNRVLLVEGSLFSVVHVIFAQVKHTVKLCRVQSVNCQGIDISNLVDITQETNYELVMRVKTDVKNVERTFFTDLNGLQMIKRKHFNKIPLQGNVYPMPTAAFIEDENTRFTLLSAQPLGVASLDVGWLEVFLDRKLMQDDNRGLFQSITDNKVTPNHFRLVFENRHSGSFSSSQAQKVGYHSLTSHLNSLTLSHALFLLHQKNVDSTSNYLNRIDVLTKSLPCDVHLLNFKTLENAQEYVEPSSSTYPNVKPKNQQVLLFHRIGVDCNSAVAALANCSTINDGTIAMNDFFKDFAFDSLEETSLSMMYSKFQLLQSSSLTFSVNIQPMDIKTFKMRLK